MYKAPIKKFDIKFKCKPHDKRKKNERDTKLLY